MVRTKPRSEEHILIGKGKHIIKKVENLIAAMNKYNTTLRKYPYPKVTSEPDKKYVRLSLQVIINKKPARLYYYIEKELVPSKILNFLQ